MKKLLALFSLASVLSGLALAAELPRDRVVVLISVDGLAHFYFDDPKAKMPTIRKLAAEGARAEKMKAVMPTVTWPNHTSIVTGVQPAKHGVLGNSLFDRDKAVSVPLIWDPLFDKEEIVKAPTIYDVAFAAGLKTAAITWPGTRGARTLNWTVPCVNKNELFLRYGTQSLWPEFKRARIPYENEALGFKDGHGQERDKIHVQMLNFILRKHRPQLALLHILEVDHVEHAYGPQSPEAYEAVKFADDCVRDVWEELKVSFPDQATLIIVSDHGFRRYSQLVQPNVMLRQAGLLTSKGKKITAAQVRSAGQGGSTMLYVMDEAKRGELIKKTAALFKGAEGIETVITPDRFDDYGLPDPAKNRQAPDLVLSAQDGYMFSEGLQGDLPVTPKGPEKGAHGYDPNLPELHATFVAWGAGIKKGVRLPTIPNTAVAPTMAALLNLKMENTDGGPLKAALTPLPKAAK